MVVRYILNFATIHVYGIRDDGNPIGLGALRW